MENVDKTILDLYLRAYRDTGDLLIAQHVFNILSSGECAHCGAPGASWQTPRTSYETDLSDYDFRSPNFVGALCARCSAEYNDYWAERWQEYYDSIR